ncbi:MAG: DNA topoisomerase I [Nanoarchaeota archaeon]|nr:DNA topoisomerase I [Nanoarchaeota archaeon]
MSEKYTLIIAEKPSAAKKIAEALADKPATKQIYMKKIPYYILQHNGKSIVVACAVGHLYTVAEKDKKGWKYPVFDMEWKASFEVNKGSSYTKPYLNLIKKLAKDAKDIVVACDYDVEGEVIGHNIVKYGCNKKDAKRMKFSTTTKEDLRESYKNLMPGMDKGQAEAGITRHELDWLFGINLSRALTLALKNATGRFKVLSSGRVQGPALNILAKREKEIQAFVPEPYWELELITEELVAQHEKGKFDERKKVEVIEKNCKGKKAIIEKVTKKKFQQEPPNPFDLTALQIESYKVLRIQPKQTLEIAQSLYINSYISYPRTSSNQLSPSIGYKKILEKLSEQPQFKELCKELLKGPLEPNNGKKTDAAHPAIYITGEIPKDLDEQEVKLYDLIARRFMATFGKPAIRESMDIKINMDKEKFKANGTRTVEENWHKYYKPYVKLKEIEIDVKEKQELKIESLGILDKETAPPKRYTPASIIKELEKKNLGTKATRSEIVESLFTRNYLRRGKSIEVTDLGLKTVDVLNKYCPEILSEDLTEEFEEDMEKIRSGKSTEEKVIKNAETFLNKVLKQFKDKENQIGTDLSGSYEDTLKEQSFIMKCDTCKDGNLQLKYTRKFKSYFIACSAYPDCTRTYSLPRDYLVKNNPTKCDECEFPEVLLIKAGKRPWVFCINPECPKKEEYKKKMAEKVNI